MGQLAGLFDLWTTKTWISSKQAASWPPSVSPARQPAWPPIILKRNKAAMMRDASQLASTTFHPDAAMPDRDKCLKNTWLVLANSYFLACRFWKDPTSWSMKNVIPSKLVWFKYVFSLRLVGYYRQKSWCIKEMWKEHAFVGTTRSYKGPYLLVISVREIPIGGMVYRYD